MPRAEIASKQALHALAKLYAELAGKLRRAKNKPPIRANIEHVAAVILMLDPNYDLSAIKPVERYRRNPLFERGNCFKVALAILKKSENPLTSKQIAKLMLFERGIREPDKKLIRHMVGVVHSSLRNHNGGIVFAEIVKNRIVWSIRATT